MTTQDAIQPAEYKPRVKEIHGGGSHYHLEFAWPDSSEFVEADGTSWVPGVREQYKERVKSWQKLRRAIKEYAKTPEYLADPYHRGPRHYPWRYLDESITYPWYLHKDVLLHFADWMEFDAEGSALVRQAEHEAEAAAVETRARVMKEAEKREREHAKYAKPAEKIQVTQVEYHYRGAFILHLDTTMWEAAYDAMCDGDTTALERERQRMEHLKEAVKTYRREHERDVRKREGYPLHAINGYTWHLRKDILIHFVDWFEFDAPLETLMKAAEAREHQRVKEHNQRVGEQRRDRKAREIEREREEREHKERVRLEREREERERSWFRRCGLPEALQELGLSIPFTDEELKRQYRRLAKQTHPDIGGDPRQFKRINHAHQCLLARG